MKILKIYEMFIDQSNVDEFQDLVKGYKFKIGDYLTCKGYSMYKAFDDDTYYYRIATIDTTDNRRPYLIRRGDELGSEFWSDGVPYELMSEEEIFAIKYNL